jgi:copper chaperone CopZ
MQNTFAVSGMTCEHCDHHVGEALAAIDGVESVSADYRTGDATVVSTRPLGDDEVSAALEEAGYALA